MNNEYILTSSGTFVSLDDLYHSGIKGMKWGVRRYQYEDGSLTPLGRKRYLNPDGTLNKKGIKKFGNSVKTAEKVETASEPQRERASDMSDSELQTRVNRLRNEDAYRDLSKKLGYDGPKTELDMKIAEMEKQKRYLELERDIKNLTPKKVSKGKQIMDTLMNKVIAPAATEAGRRVLTQYLSEAGMNAVAKALKKETDAIDKSIKKSEEKVKNKQAKQARKEAEKQAKQARKEAQKQAEKAAKEQAKAEAKAERAAEKAEAKAEKQAAKAEKQETKTSSKSTSLDNYEKRVDSILAEIDRKGWDTYNKEYRSGGTSNKTSSKNSSNSSATRNDYEREVDTLLAEIDENGWWTYKREYGGR